MISNSTLQMLLRNADHYESADFLVGDPSWWMHQVTGVENQEAMAFLASCLSYGSRKQFMPKIGKLLEWSDGNVHKWVMDGSFESVLPAEDNSCFYRLYSKGCMNSLLRIYRQMLMDYGTMGKYVQQNATDGFSAIQSICAYYNNSLFENQNSKYKNTAVPKDTTSACKRLCMFLRWMVRDNSPVDLGLWSHFIDKRTLIMPLDTHVLQQSVQLGLLSNGTASMSAARRLTAVLSEVFPDDPLRGDFALFGYGVEND